MFASQLPSAVNEERIKRPTHLRNNYFCGARFERFSLRMILHKNHEKSTTAVVKEVLCSHDI